MRTLSLVLALALTPTVAAADPLELRFAFDEGAEPRTEVVVLFTQGFSVQHGRVKKLYDCARRRLVSLDLEAKTFRDDSLLYAVGYRVSELDNRIGIQRVLAAGEVKEESFSRFALESIFGLDAGKRAGPLGDVTVAATESGWRGLHEAEEVVLFERSSTEIPEALRKSFVLYLRYRHPIHPEFLQKTTATLAPAVLRYRVTEPGAVLARSYTLSKAEPAPDAEPAIPDGFIRAHDPKDPLDVAFDRRRRGDPARTTPEAVHHFVVESAKEAPLDGLLATLELTLQDTVTGQREVTILRPHLASDPASVKVLQALPLCGEPGRAEEGAGLLDDIDRSALTKGYVLDIFKAVSFKVRGENAKAAALYLKVIDRNPWAAGPYKDLGDCYLRSFQPLLAWRCWEAAREISPGHGLLQEIDAYDRKLLAAHPEFFLD
jgi:hypothetical protein